LLPRKKSANKESGVSLGWGGGQDQMVHVAIQSHFPEKVVESGGGEMNSYVVRKTNE